MDRGRRLACIAMLALNVWGCRRQRAPLKLSIDPPTLPADGVSRARVIVSDPEARVTVRGDRRCAVLETQADGQRTLRATILPGMASIEARREAGEPPVQAQFRTVPSLADSAADGTPDILRLDSEADRDTFRRWFTFLAEAQAFREQPHSEVNDCAALPRFAYREALREHNGAWAKTLMLPSVPALPAVGKWNFPFTPFGPNVFRIVPGPFTPRDFDNGSFAEFADAQTLVRHNTYYLGKNLSRAAPADLLFFRQERQAQPFHVMIWVGPSTIAPDGAGPVVVYHTGPDGEDPGEIRRPAVEQLLRHPDQRWRPITANPGFLGVYRWNILRDTD